eukprot:PLAT6374.2.p1 GENE.PLAT6374.2~~PLAT6374.2.p1  ORF type:complete len:994 (-),score=437.85 PLAT6374.2:1017-3998(-)
MLAVMLARSASSALARAAVLMFTTLLQRAGSSASAYMDSLLLPTAADLLVSTPAFRAEYVIHLLLHLPVHARPSLLHNTSLLDMLLQAALQEDECSSSQDAALALLAHLQKQGGAHYVDSSLPSLAKPLLACLHAKRSGEQAAATLQLLLRCSDDNSALQLLTRTQHGLLHRLKLLLLRRSPPLVSASAQLLRKLLRRQQRLSGLEDGVEHAMEALRRAPDGTCWQLLQLLLALLAANSKAMLPRLRMGLPLLSELARRRQPAAWRSITRSLFKLLHRLAAAYGVGDRALTAAVTAALHAQLPSTEGAWQAELANSGALLLAALLDSGADGSSDDCFTPLLPLLRAAQATTVAYLLASVLEARQRGRCGSDDDGHHAPLQHAAMQLLFQSDWRSTAPVSRRCAGRLLLALAAADRPTDESLLQGARALPSQLAALLQCAWGECAVAAEEKATAAAAVAAMVALTTQQRAASPQLLRACSDASQLPRLLRSGDTSAALALVVYAVQANLLPPAAAAHLMSSWLPQQAGRLVGRAVHAAVDLLVQLPAVEGPAERQLLEQLAELPTAASIAALPAYLLRVAAQSEMHDAAVACTASLMPRCPKLTRQLLATEQRAGGSLLLAVACQQLPHSAALYQLVRRGWRPAEEDLPVLARLLTAAIHSDSHSVLHQGLRCLPADACAQLPRALLQDISSWAAASLAAWAGEQHSALQAGLRTLAHAGIAASDEMMEALLALRWAEPHHVHHGLQQAALQLLAAQPAAVLQGRCGRQLLAAERIHRLLSRKQLQPHVLRLLVLLPLASAARTTHRLLMLPLLSVITVAHASSSLPTAVKALLALPAAHSCAWLRTSAWLPFCLRQTIEALASTSLANARAILAFLAVASSADSVAVLAALARTPAACQSRLADTALAATRAALAAALLAAGHEASRLPGALQESLFQLAEVKEAASAAYASLPLATLLLRSLGGDCLADAALIARCCDLWALERRLAGGSSE